jgi:hypothetical protein
MAIRGFGGLADDHRVFLGTPESGVHSAWTEIETNQNRMNANEVKKRKCKKRK